MNSKSYWEHRTLLREQQAQMSIAEYLAKMRDRLMATQRSILSDIDSFFVRYAIEEKVSKKEARKLLTHDELADFVADDLASFRELALEGNQDYEYILRRASYRRRMSRLENLYLRIDMQLTELYGADDGLESYLETGLAHVYEDSYYRTLYDLTRYGAEPVVVVLSAGATAEILKDNWSGKEFSTRIWGHKRKTIENIKKTLEEGISKGHNSRKIARNIAKDVEVPYNRAVTLARTETTYYADSAAQRVYRDNDIEKYQILATLDSRTSSICREQDGEVYEVGKSTPGVNAPPFHPNCRTTTIPFIELPFDLQSKRIDGNRKKWKYVTYQEWQELNGIEESEEGEMERGRITQKFKARRRDSKKD